MGRRETPPPLLFGPRRCRPVCKPHQRDFTPVLGGGEEPQPERSGQVGGERGLRACFSAHNQPRPWDQHSRQQVPRCRAVTSGQTEHREADADAVRLPLPVPGGEHRHLSPPPSLPCQTPHAISRGPRRNYSRECQAKERDRHKQRDCRSDKAESHLKGRATEVKSEPNHLPDRELGTTVTRVPTPSREQGHGSHEKGPDRDGGYTRRKEDATEGPPDRRKHRPESAIWKIAEDAPSRQREERAPKCVSAETSLGQHQVQQRSPRRGTRQGRAGAGGRDPLRSSNDGKRP